MPRTMTSSLTSLLRLLRLMLIPCLLHVAVALPPRPPSAVSARGPQRIFDAPGRRSFALGTWQAVAANVGGRRGLFALLGELPCEAQVVMVQEHKLCQARWLATAPALRRAGWDAYAGLAGLAVVSEHGKRLGGTAVLVRAGLPATLIPVGASEPAVQGRLSCLRLEARGCELLACSVYFHSAEALGPKNRGLLAYTLSAITTISNQWLVGADWQNVPAQVAAAPPVVAVRATCAAPTVATVQPSGRVIGFSVFVWPGRVRR